MPTYILCGGSDRKIESFGPRLNTAVREHQAGPLSVLSCLFAAPPETWERDFAVRALWIRHAFGEDTTVTMALPQLFIEQIQAAHVLYIHGGDNALLEHYFSSIPDFLSLLKGKIVIGSSAGAYWFSANYWSVDWRQPFKARAITDINVMAHYESTAFDNDPRGPVNWPQAVAEFQTFLGPTASITTLHEGAFVAVDV